MTSMAIKPQAISTPQSVKINGFVSFYQYRRYGYVSIKSKLID